MHLSKYNIYFPFKNLNKNFIINPYYGKYVIVSNDTYSMLRASDMTSLINNEALVSSYIINDLDEMPDVDNENDFVKNDFFIFLTLDCNLKCIYCFQRINENYNKNQYILNKHQIDNVFKFIESITKNTYAPNIYVFGGEPLLNDSTFELVKYINETCNVIQGKVAIITNGYNIINYPELSNMKNINYIQVTIDGPRDLHNKRRLSKDGTGTFDQIIKGINLLADSQINLSVRINIDSQNINSLETLAEYFYEIEWHKIGNLTSFCGPYRDLSCYNYRYQMQEHDAIEEIFNLYKRNDKTKIIKLMGWPGIDYIAKLIYSNDYKSTKTKFCIGNYGRWAFTPDNLVYPCGTSGGNSKCAIGEYYPEIKINNDELNAWRERSIFNISKCSTCNLSLICGGGCALQSFIKNGNIYNPYCPNIYNNIKIYLKHILEGFENETQRI